MDNELFDRLSLTTLLSLDSKDEMEDDEGFDVLGRKKKGRVKNVVQYTYGGTKFSPASQTKAILPPGFYALDHNPQQGLIFDQKELVTDTLLNLPDSKSEEVIKEVESFWGLKAKFVEYGFAHKRGFILHGPPGSGKSCTIAMIIQGMVSRGGVVLMCQHPSLMRMALQQFREIEPDRPLICILEDLDSIVDQFGESSLLSVLDGEEQVDNVVFIATTNYPEKLDARIINRPSRFDRIVKIGMPNAEARALYLNHKIKTVEKDGFDLVKETEGLSIAHLRELIVSIFCQGNSTKDTLERLKKMKHKPKSDGDFNIAALG